MIVHLKEVEMPLLCEDQASCVIYMYIMCEQFMCIQYTYIVHVYTCETEEVERT